MKGNLDEVTRSFRQDFLERSGDNNDKVRLLIYWGIGLEN